MRRFAVRLGIRAGLIATMLVGMGSFAMVAGGMAPLDVMAPQAPEAVNGQPAAIRVAPMPPRIDPASIEHRPVSPGADFVATMTAEIVTTQVKGRLPESTLRAYASIAGWPSNLLDEVVVVARCESHNRSFATNGVVRGVMQVHPMWFSYSGISIESWDAPIANLQVAYGAYLYDIRRGNAAWEQWQCKPDGTVAPAAALVSGLSADSEVLAADSDEPGSPTPTTTPAPWDEEPAWPPKPNAEATPTP